MIRTKATSAERLEADLEKLNSEGAALCAKIEDLTKRESEIEDAGEIIRTMAEVRAAQNRIRRLDAEIAEVRERLATARDAARAKLRAELLAAFAPVARDFLKHARATQQAFADVVAAREALQDAGFTVDYNGLPIPPGINHSPLLAPDLLDIFDAAINPQRVVPVAVVKPSAAPKPAPVVMQAPPPPAPRRAKRAALRETAAEGERLFQLHRGTLEHARKGVIQAGDVVSLTPEEGKLLIINGAGDWIDDEQVAAIDGSSAASGATDALEHGGTAE